jgi:hypothetical protein
MILKLGSKGEDVKDLQNFLGLTADGDFGKKTEDAVKKWQKENGLTADGVVGDKTIAKMGFLSTDISENTKEVSGLLITKNFLDKDEYYTGPSKKDFLFLHHTAGGHNPYSTIKNWNNDTRGTIATEFVIGGPSVKGDDYQYDGLIVQAFPEGGYAWHLGQNGSQYMHKHSVGIEVCNFAYVVNGLTYSKTKVHESQLVTLAQPFRGHKTWHRYSDKQISELKKLILHIAERDDIDVRKGLVEEIKKKGAAGFEFNESAYYGKVKGMWTHSNTRKDKSDMFPQQELLDMLLSL